MVMVCLGVVLGVVWVQHSAQLYPLGVHAGVLAAASIVWVKRPMWRRWLCLPLAMVLGAGYASWRADMRLETRLPDALDRTTVLWTGHVVGLPERQPGGVQFVFVPERDVLNVSRTGPLFVSWYPEGADAERLADIRPGVRLSLRLRLRRTTSLFNAGGFDHAGWYLARNLAGRAYASALTVLATPDGVTVDGVRDRVRRWMEAQVEPPLVGPLVAMVLGAQEGIDDAQWRVFRSTGTAHLVAISGLHVSIVAGLAGLCAGALWRRIPRLVCRFPARDAALVAGAAAALAYASLAGFGIPVTRAVIMLGVAALAIVLRRESSPFRILLLAMMAVVVADPWAVLSAGFWLSFTAVAALLVVLAGRLGKRPKWRQFLLAQWAISWLTLPVVLGAFGAPAVISPLANAIAIPVVSVVLVPLLLLAMVTGSSTLLVGAAWVFARLYDVLAGMAAWEISAAWVTPPLFLAVLACAGLCVSLLPSGTPARRLALLCAFPLMVWRPPAPVAGTVWVTVIDVGQGLSVLVRTKRHALLYDTGRSYFRGGDAGKSVVLPALARAGVGDLDMMVLSHDDSDHVGGARSIKTELPVHQVVGGVGVELEGVAVERCADGGGWDWDGVGFRWLSPEAGVVAANDNDRSCVLLIRAGTESILLTGDITRDVESALIARHDLRGMSVVVAPHHGSKSSSSPEFVQHVGAEHVIFSAGYQNPYHHPARVVVDRWHERGARGWNTAQVGAISVTSSASHTEVRSTVERIRRYWHRP